MSHQIGTLFVIVGLMVLLFQYFKQPLIPAYVLAGLLASPLALNMVHDPKALTELSEMAVVVMLFVIGVEMDLGRLRALGPVAVGGGILQVASCFGIGFVTGKFFGQTSVASTYLGFAAAFSSTMVTVKILGDKQDLSTLYGRISVGILVMQDVLAIFALSILINLDKLSLKTITNTVTLAAGLILIVVLVLGQYVFPKLLSFAARDRDTLFAVTMLVLFGIGFFAEAQQLSLGIGSFLAGLAVSRLSYQYEIAGDLKALKAFFSILFFTTLGLGFSPQGSGVDGAYSAATLMNTLGEYGWFIAAFALIAIVIKPLLVMLIVAMFGYDRSTAFSTALSLGQLSEFSLVLVSTGIASNHLPAAILPPIIVVTVVSMTAASYLMKYDLALYRFASPGLFWLRFLALKKQPLTDSEEPSKSYKILLVGRDRLGGIIEQSLRKMQAEYIVVDSNPDIIAVLRRENVPSVFGDINNHEVLAKLDFKKFTTVISSVPSVRDNELLLKFLEKNNPGANYIAIADSRRTARELYSIGVHFVIVPYMVAGEHLLGQRTEESLSLNQLICGTPEIRERGKTHKDELGEILYPIIFPTTAQGVPAADISV